MSFTDWTQSGSASAVLDSGTKYAGNSSLCIYYPISANWGTGYFTHNTFSKSQAQVILWTRADANVINQRVILTTYGALECRPSANYEWQKFRLTFWYDSQNNTKWGRIEKWINNTWVQQGTDSNFGTGSPTAGLLQLYFYGSFAWSWFDEVEVYS